MNRPRLLFILILIISVAALARIKLAQAAAPPSAAAELRDAKGKVVGSAAFTTLSSGAVKVQVAVTGLSGNPGEHGLHIHAVGSCAPDFGAAGGHFNPTGAQHGLSNPAGAHAGDLPNLTLAANGSAVYETTIDRVTLAVGQVNSVFDADGSAVVIHAGPDDNQTSPAGNSGARIACGVIMPATSGAGTVSMSHGSVTFNTCKGTCAAQSVDPAKAGPVRDWQKFTLTGKGIQTTFADQAGRPQSYVGRPATVCFKYTAEEAAAAGGASRLRVAYWDTALPDGGRWYVLRTTHRRTRPARCCASPQPSRWCNSRNIPVPFYHTEVHHDNDDY